jgi:hypothetical protein
MTGADDFVALLLRENRRLRKEVERLRAIESSRWWRLNPRPWIRRLAGSLHTAARGGPRPEHTEPASATSGVSGDERARFRAEVVARGAFTADWFTKSLPRWQPLMSELEGRRARVLEIGSFEGLSACYVLWRLRDAVVTCVDTFEGSPEHTADERIPSPGLEAVFDANVALVDAARVRKVVGDSRRVLLDLLGEGARFDLVYVDGSHLALDVLVDAALSWRLLEEGGFLVFDDYTWSELGDDVLLRPGPGIDAFLALVRGKCELFFSGPQVAVRKISP